MNLNVRALNLYVRAVHLYVTALNLHVRARYLHERVHLHIRAYHLVEDHGGVEGRELLEGRCAEVEGKEEKRRLLQEERG